jgi:hypothetical protein
MGIAERIENSEGITAEWMTKALDVDIASVDVTQIGAGVGIASLLYRAKLTYAHEANGPTSVVVKLPATDEGTRMVMNLFDFYSKECRFYAELADATPVNTPTIHHNDVDVDTNDFVLVMEDLVGVRSVDQIEGCTLAEAMAAMSSLARIHATWWEAGPIEDVEWLPRPGDSPYPEALAGQVAASWPNVMADHADLVSSETAALGYFMSQSLDSKMRAEHERDLLSHYHSELVANGVEGYDPDEMWDDYRLGILYCFAYPASAAARAGER